MTYSDLEKRNIKILKKNNTLAREPTLSKNLMEPSFGEMLTFPWWRCGSSPMTAWRRSQCSAVKALFSTKTTKKRSVADPARTRTWNPLIRSQMPYPSGHGAFPPIKAIVKAKKIRGTTFWNEISSIDIWTRYSFPYLGYFHEHFYGGPQVHSEFQTTPSILNLTPNSWTSLSILEPHFEFLNLTTNSKNSLRILKTHSKFLNFTPNPKNSLWIFKTHSKFLSFTPNSKSSLRIRIKLQGTGSSYLEMHLG